MRRGVSEFRFGLEALCHDSVGRFVVRRALAAGVVGGIEAAQEPLQGAEEVDGDAGLATRIMRLNIATVTAASPRWAYAAAIR